MSELRIWDNPLIVRGVRTRLRLPLLLSWAMITLVASIFLYTVVYGNAIKNPNTSVQEAAREAILPLLVMQGIILMVLGTGAVAGGMARERTDRLLDYQRLTPMSPGAKIVGLLIGLPIREYFMFAISLPMVFYAAWVGELSFIVLFQFYIVFISSAVVYHMTGLAAGMVVDKPWRAGTVSQGLVVVLYLLLPQASHIGFTFFEFLTARPVFYGMVNQHLMPSWMAEAMQTGGVQENLRHLRYQSVDFFGMKLPPIYFSLAVQAYAILSLYVIVHRKWQSESRLAFSKGYALVFFAIAQLFLVGSVQPYLRIDALFFGLSSNYHEMDPVHNPTQVIVFGIFLLMLTVSGCMAMLTVYLCTPTWYQSITGLRRAVKRGHRRLPWSDDTTSSLPIAVACLLMSWLGFIAIYQSAVAAGRVTVDNPLAEIVLPLAFFAVVLVTVQQVVEQFSERIFVMSLFVFWLIPVLIGIIVATVAESPVLAVYLAAPFPLLGLWGSSALLNSDEARAMSTDVIPLAVREQTLSVVVVSVMLYSALMLMLLLKANRRWLAIRKAAGAEPAPQHQAPARIADSSAEIAPAYVRTGD